MRKSTMHVGLDVHKDSIEITTAEAGRDGEVRRFGQVGGDLASLEKAVRKLQSKGRNLRFVYEAGPCVTSSIGTSGRRVAMVKIVLRIHTGSWRTLAFSCGARSAF